LQELQQQLDERNDEYERANIEIARLEGKLAETNEKLQEAIAATRVAEEMNVMMREELVRKQRDLDELTARVNSANSRAKEDSLNAGNDSVEYQAGNMSINMERNINAVLSRNKETLAELDRLCRIISAQQRQQLRLAQTVRRSRGPLPRVASRASSGYGGSMTSGNNEVMEQPPAQIILSAIHEFGKKMQELMQEHAEMWRHLEERTGLRNLFGSDRIPSRLSSTETVTVEALDLRALGGLGDDMSRITSAFLEQVEKLAPGLVRSILDAASSTTAVEGGEY
jgi:DNA repair exonuclease SbcCD ATPase subunit